MFFTSLIALALHAGPADAQLARTFLSANGSDSNTCARAAPCRTLQVAHNKTNAGGEINVLDPAGYGAVTIDKSISIVNEGVGSAGILVTGGGTGITINGGVNDKINLRGLIIEGGGVGQHGIVFNAGKSLTIENCVIRNMTNDGIQFLPTASSSLAVSNSFVADNGNIGIIVYPNGSGAATAEFNRVEVYNSGNQGILVAGGTSNGSVTATIADSVAARNANSGFLVTLPGAASVSLMVARSVSSNNGTGISSNGGANATVRAVQSIITGNNFGWSTTSGGVFLSYGDNAIDGNADDGGIPPLVSKR
jgi:hypothetical protein